MERALSPDRKVRLTRATDLLTGLAGVIAAVVLVGWALHYEPFKRIAPGLASMNPLTAVTFLATAAALLSSRGRIGGERHLLWGRWLALPAVLVGASKILDLLLGTSMCPDDVLFADQLVVGQAFSSRVAPNTAFCFLLLGIGTLASTLTRQPRMPVLQLLAVPILLLAALAILGYSYDTTGFYRLRTFNPMAVHTAVCFALMSAALMLSQPEQGFVGLLTGDDEAGRIARVLLPTCVLIPLVLGWVAITGLRLEYYGLGTAISVLVLLIVLVLCVAVILVSGRLRREEAQRRLADQSLVAKNAEIEAKAAELAGANVQLLQANAAKSSFLSAMSHEIRTPMNAVIGMTSLLLNTELSKEQKDFAETIRASGDHLLTVINEILDFSKIEAGRMTLEHSLFDLQQCVEDAIDLVSVTAAEKELELAFYLEAGCEGSYFGDVGRLRQILINLLSNAVKFTHRGEVVLNVSATAAADGVRELHFSVRDTGIGIPADRLSGLFQPFTQVDASTTRKYGGTGLGLAISLKLAELMGGRASAKSEPGQGSTFHFTIRVQAGTTEAAAPQAASPLPLLGGKRMLVVDDNPTNLRIVEAYAKSWDMSTASESLPSGALRRLRAGERFDVAVIDFHMPEMDGLELAGEIRRTSTGATLPLVLFSSMTIGRQELSLRDPRFTVLITKPVKPAALEAAVAEALRAAAAPARAPTSERRNLPLDGTLATRHALRILLVEDNLANQKVATLLLRKLGYTTDIAANGLEALAAVERQTYDVVLMDVQMPEMDGLEATRQIVARWPDEDDRPRLVGMTANATDGDRRDCIKAGMDDYLSKPVTVPELVAALQRTPTRIAA